MIIVLVIFIYLFLVFYIDHCVDVG